MFKGKTFAWSARNPCEMEMAKTSFGSNCRGEPVVCYTISNNHGMSLSVMNHGATILSLIIPDASGKKTDVVLGHDTAAEYDRTSAYFGSVIGRYANRIRGGKFTLNGKVFQLVTNDGNNTLHGGPQGFDSVLWREGPKTNCDQLELLYTSPDGEQGFPAAVDVTVRYGLTDKNELRIEYRARSSAATPVNLTNHAYFNLRGHDAGDCLDHILTLDADTYLPADEQLIPTGERRAVSGTVFDFRRERRIGEGIGSDDEQVKCAGGYDHTFCLRSSQGNPLRKAAHVIEPMSGRSMTVFTTEPGLQFYSGNQLHGGLIGKGGCRYDRYAGFCLETQHFPNSPNEPDFPDTILVPGKTFLSTTVYKFSDPE